jgi:hypothetical protein
VFHYLTCFPATYPFVRNRNRNGALELISLEGNEIVDDCRPLSPVDSQGLARSVLPREWQRKWDTADRGRFAHSMLPKVSLRPWFEGQREDRNFFPLCRE